jgi:hypothetical protein
MKIVPFTQRFILNGSFLLLLAVGLFSCSSKSDLAKHIPKDANVVLAFDVKSMGYKSLNFKEILTLDNVKKALSDLGKEDTATANFENSGIDFLSKAYFFAKATENAPYGGVIVALSDAKKFETFLKENDKDIKISKEGSVNVASFEAETAIVVWNDSEVILLFGKEKVKELALNAANLKEENSLAANNSVFADLEKESADISCWVNFENLEKLIPAYAATTGMFNFKETYLTATCNFEDGQIVVKSKYTTNKEAAEKLTFVRSSVSKELASTLPGHSVIGMLGFALDMEKIYAYLDKEKMMDAYGGVVTQSTGLTAKEFFDMLNGDIAMTVNGIQMKEVKSLNWTTGEEVTNQVPDPEYFAALGVGNKDNLQKLLQHLEQSGMLTKAENVYSYQDKVFITEQGSTLIITGSAAMKDLAVSGKNEKLNDELMSVLTGNSSSFYLNLNNVPDAVYASTQSPMVGSNIKNSEVEDILVTGTNTSATVTSGTFVIRFKNKSENSLVTVTRISKKFAESMNENPVVSNMEPSTEILEEVEPDTDAVN